MQACSVFSLQECLVVVTFLSENCVVLIALSFLCSAHLILVFFFFLSWRIQASFPGEDNRLEFTLEHLYSLANVWRRLAGNIICHETHIN